MGGGEPAVGRAGHILLFFLVEETFEDAVLVTGLAFFLIDATSLRQKVSQTARLLWFLETQVTFRQNLEEIILSSSCVHRYLLKGLGPTHTNGSVMVFILTDDWRLSLHFCFRLNKPIECRYIICMFH